MGKKGAFQLSMSFIITVVFAVVLLSLAIVWLQGTISDVTDMSGTMLGNAREKIRQLFQENDDNFYIWPENFPLNLEKDTIIGVAAIIKNDAFDGEKHEFVINVYSTKVPNGMKESEVNDWIDFTPTSKTVKVGGEVEREIRMRIPRNAKKGNYFFEVAACWDDGGKVPASDKCNGRSDSLWGDSALDFVLTVQ